MPVMNMTLCVNVEPSINKDLYAQKPFFSLQETKWSIVKDMSFYDLAYIFLYLSDPSWEMKARFFLNLVCSVCLI